MFCVVFFIYLKHRSDGRKHSAVVSCGCGQLNEGRRVRALANPSGLCPHAAHHIGSAVTVAAPFGRCNNGLLAVLTQPLAASKYRGTGAGHSELLRDSVLSSSLSHENDLLVK